MVKVLKEFEFQNRCIEELIESTIGFKEELIVLKSPTGSGKTVMLQKYIKRFLLEVSQNVVFIWLTPGRGSLEKQSKETMEFFFPELNARDLDHVLASGFDFGDTVFMNWEKVTKTGNLAISDSEYSNLYEKINEARNSGIEFILIIDEEHQNDTSKANKLINHFNPKSLIRVSATAKEHTGAKNIIIDESSVIDEELISRAIFINEGFESKEVVANEEKYLIDMAIKKRTQILNEYIKIGKNINPLVVIQFPNKSDVLIGYVENYLESLGYTYENGHLAIWMDTDERKINQDPENLKKNNSNVDFILMKEAISVGWDCPRAKILIKLREGGSEQFQIQTIGRIRRMPERKFYNNSILDNSYLYTFDEDYKQEVIQNIDHAYELKYVELKEKCKEFHLEKQLKNHEKDGYGAREAFIVIKKHIDEQFDLTDSVSENKAILENHGFELSEDIKSYTKTGKAIKSEDLLIKTNYEWKETFFLVDTHRHGMKFKESVGKISKNCGMRYNKVRAILDRLFRRTKGFRQNKVLELETKPYYAFIINNIDKLVYIFTKAIIDVTEQLTIEEAEGHYKVEKFTLPSDEFIKYDPNYSDSVEITSNAYYSYPSSSWIYRSNSERLFEQYCENNGNVDWIYKNGDSGQKYFSIVYVDNLKKQWLFYPDYIVMLNSGEFWIIETKGGETKEGQDKNIDKKVILKFNAIKKYCLERNINWAFVREDRLNNLFFNNLEYKDDMSDPVWKSLKNIF